MSLQFIAFAGLQHGQIVLKANCKIQQLLVGFFPTIQLTFAAMLNSMCYVMYTQRGTLQLFNVNKIEPAHMLCCNLFLFVYLFYFYFIFVLRLLF